MARCILKGFSLCKDQSKLIIYEIGPGNGILARDVLDHLKKTYPNVYETCEYHLVEISKSLAKVQSQTLSGHLGKYTIHNTNFNHLNRVNHPCTLIALEVLDNQAADLVRFHPQNGELLNGIIKEKNVEYADRFELAFERCKDSLIISTSKIINEYYVHSNQDWPCISSWRSKLFNSLPIQISKLLQNNPHTYQFIPTGIKQILQNISTLFPNIQRLIISDFSSIPEPIDGNTGSPRVQVHVNGEPVSCRSFLLERGIADIIFPVDFNLLQHMMFSENHIRPKSIQRSSHEKFYREFGDLGKSTMYDPILHDYQNMHYLTADY